MSSLRKKKCGPCEGGTPKFDEKQIRKYLKKIDSWEYQDDRLHKSLTFFDFAEAMGFVNQMADLAEDEGHHPDFCVHWNQVNVVIWTHAIGGLSENDFILASKIDALLE